MRNFPLSLLIVLAILGFGTLSAQQFQVDQLTYGVISDNTCRIVSASAQTPAVLVVPESVEHDGTTYTVTEIGANAFDLATSMTSITLPATLKVIESAAFYKPTKLKDIICHATTPPDVSASPFANTVLSNVTLTVPAGCYLAYVENWTRFIRIVEPGSTTLTQNGFKFTIVSPTSKYARIDANNYSGEISIPATFTHEGETYTLVEVSQKCFNGNGNVTKLTLPPTLLVLGEYCFQKMSKITELELPQSVLYIKYGILSQTPIKKIVLPNKVKYLMNVAFQKCTALEEVTLPDSLEIMGNAAFSGCTALTTVHGGQNVRIMEGAIYNGDKALVNYTFPPGLESLGSIAFSGTGIKFHKLPEKVKAIETQTFMNCYNLTDIDLSNITRIQTSAFNGCSNLANVVMPDTMAADDWGSMVFQGCKALKNIRLPEGITQLGAQTFYNCTSLDSVMIPASVTSFGNMAFRNCTSLKRITLPPALYSLKLGVFQGCTALEEIYMPTCPNSEIGNQTFYGCTNLHKAVLPRTLLTLGNFTFLNCTNLAEVVLGDSLRQINYNAFQNCQSLTNFDAPDSLRTIGKLAFDGCSNLKSVRFKKVVESMDDNVFTNCPALVSIECQNPIPPTVPENAFDSLTYHKAVLGVPQSAIETYRKAQTWSKFSDITLGVNNLLNEDAAIIRREYYSLTGLRLTEAPDHGVIIVVEYFADGTRRIVKTVH